MSVEELEELHNAKKTVVGTRQTVRALEQDEVLKVFIAQNAEDKVTMPVIKMCQQKDVNVSYVESMNELGKACNIKVGAAMAAIVKE